MSRFGTDQGHFASTLTAALAGSPASLEQLSNRLAELGTPVSTATLSYWTSGRSLPSRPRSKQAVAHLETLLDLPPGHLMSALPGELNAAWNPGVGVRDLRAVQRVAGGLGLDLRRHLEAIMLTDHLRLDAARTTMVQESHQLHWADDARVDRFTLLLLHPGAQSRLADLVVDRGARLGAHAEVPGGELTVAEVVLERPLLQGDLGQVRYTATWQSEEAIDGHDRRLPIEMGRLVQSVHFEGSAPGRLERVHTAVDGTRKHQELPASRHPQVFLQDVQAGLHRLAWQD